MRSGPFMAHVKNKQVEMLPSKASTKGPSAAATSPNKNPSVVVDAAGAPPLASAAKAATAKKAASAAKEAEADPPPMTPEQDAALIGMKHAKCSWDAMAGVVGVSADRIRKRWKQLQVQTRLLEQGGGGGGEGGGGGGEKGGEKRGGVAPTELAETLQTVAAEAEKERPELQVEHEHKHSRRRHHLHHTTASSQRSHSTAPSRISTTTTSTTMTASLFDGAATVELAEDDTFSFGELQALVELLERDQRYVWDRVAAAFYDLSGRRVEPGVVAEKFGVAAEGGRVRAAVRE